VIGGTAVCAVESYEKSDAATAGSRRFSLGYSGNLMFRAANLLTSIACHEPFDGVCVPGFGLSENPRGRLKLASS